jgi:hypothetical protein
VFAEQIVVNPPKNNSVQLLRNSLQCCSVISNDLFSVMQAREMDAEERKSKTAHRKMLDSLMSLQGGLAMTFVFNSVTRRGEELSSLPPEERMCSQRFNPTHSEIGLRNRQFVCHALHPPSNLASLPKGFGGVKERAK